MIVSEIAVRKRHLAVVITDTLPDLQDLLYEKNEWIFETEKGFPLIDRTILERCNIAKGTALSGADCLELVKASCCFRAKERAIWYLSKSERSRHGLQDKLTPVFGRAAAQFAVDQMEKRGYLDDRRFATMVANGLNGQNVSYRAALQKLLQKGIEKQLAQDVLEEVFETDETQKAVAVILKKYAHKLENPNDVQKTTAALARRGFSYATIRAAYAVIREEEVL